jgi:hypothetical protein
MAGALLLLIAAIFGLARMTAKMNQGLPEGRFGQPFPTCLQGVLHLKIGFVQTAGLPHNPFAKSLYGSI